MCQTPSPLGDHHSLPTLGGAFAALFQARNLALHTACHPHRHCWAHTEHDSARREQNKGSQSLLSSYLRQSLNAIQVFRQYIDGIYALKHNKTENKE